MQKNPLGTIFPLDFRRRKCYTESIGLCINELLTSQYSDIASCDQTQSFQLPAVLIAGGDQVNARRVNAAVAQHIRQMRDIPARFIKNPREQMPQIVGEYLRRRNS